MVKNKKWNKFNKLTGKCYNNLIGAEKDDSCWMQAFELLLEIVREERQAVPNYAPNLEWLDDATDYEYDIQGWLEDCLDEVDMKEDYNTLLNMCDTLLDMFGWPEYTGSDLKTRKAVTLAALGRKEEAAAFCEKWLKKEPENIVAATANVYAYLGIQKFEEAEKLVDEFIPDKTQCTEENDFMFMAAQTLYMVTKQEQKRESIEKAMQEFEEQLEEWFGADEDDDLDFLTDDDWYEDMEDDLPFK